MGIKHSKAPKKDKILDLTLCPIDTIFDDSFSVNSNSDNKKTENNEKSNIIESKEFILEGKEEEIKEKYLKDEEDFFDDGKDYYFKLSKNSNKNKLENAPKTHIKQFNEYMSPLILEHKNYGNNSLIWNQRINKTTLYDYQSNLIECKSCGEDYLEDYSSFNLDTERTTPNVEDLQNLLTCRKKMSDFRSSINERDLKEYENILNCDLLIDDEKKEKKQNKKKKKKYWNKHIKLQNLKYKNKMFDSNFRASSNNQDKKRSETIDNENIVDHGLFILGILESAANESKRRNTVNV